jgi:tryptophan synthase alpha chain
MTVRATNRVVQTFSSLRAAGKQTLLPFVTAGYPDLDVTLALLRDFEARGVRVCELGVPFSDPVADGPVIQASYAEALAAGVNTGRIFDTVRAYRRGGGKMAVLAMVSYSIVFRRGVEAFFAAAAGAGFDGTIIPDLPVEEARPVEALAAAKGLANVLLVAPTTPPPRQAEIARASRGFVYFVSVAGITGARDRLPPETIAAVAELRKHTETPICVGFGISNAETVANVCKVADGAIVGSAIVKKLTERKSAAREQMVAAAGELVSELLKPVA